MSDWICLREGGDYPWTVLSEQMDFGLRVCDLVGPPRRFWADVGIGDPVVQPYEDFAHLEPQATPCALVDALPPGDNWSAMTRRSLARAFAWFLAAEDPQRRVEARRVSTLAHQASLVHHILKEPALQNVLIADEVGLGKTIEAALLVKELLEAQARVRVLYLAPARLVRNVRKELDKLDLSFHVWVSGEDKDARLTDSRVVASIHRAVHPKHFDDFVDQVWDVIIVDECHHLSDWAAGGGNQTRKYRLVQELLEGRAPSARLILMSGTPHQGHAPRFENLLALLKKPGEELASVKGRVIYRTKEDVVDWDGRPLFPKRRVNQPHVVDLGAPYRRWLEEIYELFVPARHELGASDARRRASGWRASQAMQWAASSIQAGLGYLVRQGIRADWDASHPGMAAALRALRPYRGGDADEDPVALFARMQKGVERQAATNDIEDMEEAAEAEERWAPDTAQLEQLLADGVRLLETCADEKWDFLWQQVLEPAGDEKVVLFAQPIETVTTLARYLEKRSGQAPAIIIGDQSEDQREAVVERFWRPDGPQFLVSSRAGGEGINLQVSRRAVHVDVPWNPMELEQRVGRVHRFLSRKTVIVDTVVVKDSREVDAYRVAREKLRDITCSLGDGERFEEMFSRVMALVPPESLQDVLVDRPMGPLTDDEARRVSELVVEGFKRWKSFHEQYSEQHKEIARLDAGLTSWDDLADFAKQYLKAKDVEGFSTLGFELRDGEVEELESEARVLEIEGELYSCGDSSGMPVVGRDGRTAKPLGLNVPCVAKELRRLALPTQPTGAAHVKWPADQALPLPDVDRPFGVLMAVRQSVREVEGAWVEKGLELFAKVVTRQGRAVDVEGAQKGELVRGLSKATIRVSPGTAPEIVSRMREIESGWRAEVCRPSAEEREAKVRHGLTPLLAAIVE